MQQKSHFQTLPLPGSHLEFAHSLWAKYLQGGAWAIDATCGQGRDTLYLARCLEGTEGGVIALDIQEEAILKTAQYLQQHLSPAGLAKVHLFHQSHEEFPPMAYKKPIQLIVYNLGYLPSGDHALTTLTPTTLKSVERGLLLSNTLSITCYPGHPEGLIEQRALLSWASSLNSEQWHSCHYVNEGRATAPSLLTIAKKT